MEKIAEQKSNDKDLLSIPYVVYEQEKIRSEKTHKMLFILCIILVVALIATNIAWIIYENQFETVKESVEEYWYDVEQENDNGDNNFIGHDGDIRYGETESKSARQEND